MNLVKLTILNEPAAGVYFIGEPAASRLLSSDFKEPIALNGLEHYVDPLSATYRRLSITEYTRFTLERAKSTDVPVVNR